MKYKPHYLQMYRDGTLKKMSDSLYSVCTKCTLCPHRCGIDRTAGETGKCRSGMTPVVSSFHAHFGEESCLVGRNGSGTIFFTNCNLSCIFCQNYDISHLGRGEDIDCRELAAMMIALQARGCHNINFVSPTHMVYPVIQALLIAIPEGLHVPLVYNSGGYDSVDTLRMISGVFDIYMPDFKYMDSEQAKKLSGAADYPTVAMAALREMHDQVGDLITDSAGAAQRGLIVRHLVLPGNIAATDKVLSFIAALSKDTFVNIMDQYRPEYRARECFDLRRRITLQEYDEAVKTALDAGLHRIDGHTFL